MEQEAMNEIRQLEQEIELLTGKHQIVMDTLSRLDRSRQVFHLENGEVVEFSIGELLPDLERQYYWDLLPKTVEAIEDKLAKKGVQLNDFIIRHQLDIPLHDVYVPVAKELREQKEREDAAAADKDNAFNQETEANLDILQDDDSEDDSEDAEVQEANAESDEAQDEDCQTEKAPRNPGEVNRGEKE